MRSFNANSTASGLPASNRVPTTVAATHCLN